MIEKMSPGSPDQEMTFELRRLSDLSPAEYNPRTTLQPGDPEYESLKKSIETFGYLDPIIVNSDGTIIGGHQRYNVLLDLGYEEAQVVIVDLDKETEKALNVALNKISGGWDELKLKEILSDLDLSGMDLSAVGFSRQEFEDLCIRLDDEDVPVQEDEDFNVNEALEAIKEPKTKLGDVYRLGRHRLMCGDSTKSEDIKKLVSNQKIDMVLTDPPYGMFLDTDFSGIVGSLKSIGRKNHTRGNKYDAVIGDNEDFKPELISTIFNNFQTCSEIFLFGADYYAELIPDRNAGSWLVWDKRKESQADAIGSEFELIWSKAKHKRRMLRHDWFGFLASEDQQDARNRVHPTQKPISLLADIIKQWGKDAEVICDLYGGSGSTLMACEQLDRACCMMEIDPKYCDVIVQRWESYTGEKAVIL